MTVTQEAERLVNGDRQEDYGNPLDNWTKIANMCTALLEEKLICPLTAEDMVLVMNQVKVAREIYKPKRDNRTDIAGYAQVLELIKREREERERRSDNNGI